MSKGAKKISRLLLVGDSMIEYGDWSNLLPGLEVHNLGRSGESVEELRERTSRIVTRQKPPDLILVMIGTNNVALGRFDFLGDYGGILASFKAAWPETRLVVNSLLPMDLYYLEPQAVARVNDSLRRLAGRAGADYLDAWSVMVDPTGQPLPGVLADEVHLSARGYRLWAAVIREYLDAAGKAPAH
jgi:lysophospholipase L1-like esterase